MAQRRSARPHKKVLHETSDDDLLEDSEKELTSADVLVKAHPVVEDEKTAKIQEKNRRAQRKFRERRKERMNHMEKSIISLNDQIKALKVENRMFKELLTVKERQLQVAKVGDKSTGSFSYPDYDPIDMSWLPGYGDASLSNEKIRHMSDDELFQMCMKIFTMLDQQLRMCDTSNPNGVDQGKLTSLVKGGTSFWARCLLVEPVRTREIVGRIQATRQNSDKSPQASRQAVGSNMIKELGLSPEQMRQMSEAWMKYKAALEQMLGDREACSKELMALRPDPDNEMRNLQIFLQENKVVEQLRSTMQRENKLFLECMHEVAHKTLNPLQLARFILHGKPYMDMLSLCKAVAVEMEGEESAQLRPSARQRSVLCTALDNVGAPTTWLDADLQSDLRALGGRLQVAQNPQAPVTSMSLSHQSQPPSLDGRSRQHSPLNSTGSPLNSTQTLPTVNANHNTLYEGLAHFRSNRSQFGELPAPTPLDSQSVFAMQAPGKAATGAAPMSTASKERNMLLQDIFSTYHTNNSNTINVAEMPQGHGGFQSGVMPSNQMQVSGAEIFNRPGPSSQQHMHGGDPYLRNDPRHRPLDGESAFMAPGINSAGNSISLGEAAAHARRSTDASLASLGRTDHNPEPHDAANASADRLGLTMPQPSPSLDMFANYEPNGSMFQDTGLMSRFTSTSLHLMESCELRADQRNDTLMNMIDKLPNVPASGAAAAHHAALADVFDAAGMPASGHGHGHGTLQGGGGANPALHGAHAMQPPALQPVTTGITLFHGHM